MLQNDLKESGRTEFVRSCKGFKFEAPLAIYFPFTDRRTNEGFEVKNIAKTTADLTTK